MSWLQFWAKVCMKTLQICSCNYATMTKTVLINITTASTYTIFNAPTEPPFIIHSGCSDCGMLKKIQTFTAVIWLWYPSAGLTHKIVFTEDEPTPLPL